VLTALQAQTLLPSRVIVSDDSTDGDFLSLLAQPAQAEVVQRINIEVVRGPRQGA